MPKRRRHAPPDDKEKQKLEKFLAKKFGLKRNQLDNAIGEATQHHTREDFANLLRRWLRNRPHS